MESIQENDTIETSLFSNKEKREQRASTSTTSTECGDNLPLIWKDNNDGKRDSHILETLKNSQTTQAMEGETFISWLFQKYFFGKHSAYRERTILGILLTILLIALIVLVIYVYERMKQSNEYYDREINYLRGKIEHKLPYLKQQDGYGERVKKTFKGRDNFGKVMIKAVGNGQDDMSVVNQPLHNWKESLRQGNISFHQGKRVMIKMRGYYLVQVRMFFKGNENFKEEHLDYGVIKEKWRQRPVFIMAATRSKDICGRACSLSISEIVLLEEGDKLSIQTRYSGQNFAMFEDKTSFGVCKLN